MDHNHILVISNHGKFMLISKDKRQTAKSKQRPQIYGNHTSP